MMDFSTRVYLHYMYPKRLTAEAGRRSQNLNLILAIKSGSKEISQNVK
jgi:hypothetical protein